MGLVRLLLCGLVLLVARDARAEEALRWEVVNNFRVVSEKDQQRYFDSIEKYRECAETNGRAKGCNTAGVRNPKYPSPTFVDYGTHWSRKHQRYNAKSSNFAISNSRTIVATLTQNRGKAAAPCSWTVNGKAIPSARSCREAKLPVEVGQSEIAVISEKSGEAIHRSTIELKDIVIGVIGDSFASGEGTPHIFERLRQARHGSGGIETSPETYSTARWWDDRCHRSLFSNSAIAAAHLARANKHLSVTYLSYACSGGEISEGLIKEYAGRETWPQLDFRYRQIANETLPPTFKGAKLEKQLAQLKSELCQRGRSLGPCLGYRKIDYLVISTGVNDIGFSEIVRALATDDCDRRTDACLNKIKEKIDRQIEDFVENKYARLIAEFASLKIGNVVLVEYPDPTQKRPNVWCDDFKSFNNPFLPGIAAFFGYGIGPNEAKWAHHNVVIPLNDALKRVISQHPSSDWSWRYVGGIAELSRSRGYCNKTSRWFVDYQEALEKQGYVYNVEAADKAGLPTGAMHPNILAHYSIAAEMEKLFVQDGLMPAAGR